MMTCTNLSSIFESISIFSLFVVVFKDGEFFSFLLINQVSPIIRITSHGTGKYFNIFHGQLFYNYLTSYDNL